MLQSATWPATQESQTQKGATQDRKSGNPGGGKERLRKGHCEKAVTHNASSGQTRSEKWQYKCARAQRKRTWAMRIVARERAPTRRGGCCERMRQNRIWGSVHSKCTYDFLFSRLIKIWFLEKQPPFRFFPEFAWACRILALLACNSWSPADSTLQTIGYWSGDDCNVNLIFDWATLVEQYVRNASHKHFHWVIVGQPMCLTYKSPSLYEWTASSVLPLQKVEHWRLLQAEVINLIRRLLTLLATTMQSIIYLNHWITLSLRDIICFTAVDTLRCNNPIKCSTGSLKCCLRKIKSLG